MKKIFKKIFKITLLTFLAAILTIAAIILFPQSLFANKIKYKEFTVRSNNIIDNNIKIILDNVMNFVQKSELYDSTYKYDIILCHNSFYNKIVHALLPNTVYSLLPISVHPCCQKLSIPCCHFLCILICQLHQVKDMRIITEEFDGESKNNVVQASILAGVQYFLLPRFSIGMEANVSAGLDFSNSRTHQNGAVVRTDKGTLFEIGPHLFRLLYLSYHFGSPANKSDNNTPSKQRSNG